MSNAISALYYNLQAWYYHNSPPTPFHDCISNVMMERNDDGKSFAIAYFHFAPTEFLRVRVNNRAIHIDVDGKQFTFNRHTLSEDLTESFLRHLCYSLTAVRTEGMQVLIGDVLLEKLVDTGKVRETISWEVVQ